MAQLKERLGLQVATKFFWNFCGFSKGCFSMLLGNSFSFEVELYGFMIAVELEYKFRWYLLWIETDSIYVALLFRNDSDKVLWRFRSRWVRTL